jgi:osomolarity two-component system phosphorelay intermediate protein YPD1
VKKDATGTQDEPDDDKCLEAIKTALTSMREEYNKADRYFKRLYPEQ